MRILFTGASSFTGYWFVRALVEGGHDVTTTFTAPSLDAYTGIRRRRIDLLPAAISREYACPFGSEPMLALIRRQPWDLFCHHGAVVGSGYKSGAFDYIQAVQANTHKLEVVLDTLLGSECRRVLLTGSYFEADTGTGSNREAVSPYGLSKTLTWHAFRHFCHVKKLALGKFVIPNPFGPLEEGRLGNYLAKCWLSGATPTLQTPDYVRDFIPVDLLASAYRKFAEQFVERNDSPTVHEPSFWVETNLAFAQRMAENLAPLLGVKCPVSSAIQTRFSEPLSRQNMDRLSTETLDWREASFWKQLAFYYHPSSMPPQEL